MSESNGRALVPVRSRGALATRALPRKPPRPSPYKPEYCERVIELGKQGNSPAQIASELGFSKAVLWVWAKKHPEFGAAMERAKTEEQAWWEKEGRVGMRMGSGGFNGLVWKVAMQARFKDDYTERKEFNGGVPFQLIISTKDKALL
jgi:hypothetical protein